MVWGVQAACEAGVKSGGEASGGGENLGGGGAEVSGQGGGEGVGEVGGEGSDSALMATSKATEIGIDTRPSALARRPQTAETVAVLLGDGLEAADAGPCSSSSCSNSKDRLAHRECFMRGRGDCPSAF